MHVSYRVWNVNFLCSQPDPRHGNSKWHLSVLELLCTAEPPPPCRLPRQRAGPAAHREPSSPVRGVYEQLWGVPLFFWGDSYSDPKDPTLELCRREGAVTKWDWKEKWADSTFEIPFRRWWSYEQHQWSLSQEQELVPSFPGHSFGSHSPTAPPTSGKDLPPGKNKVCMAFSASLVPFKSSGLGKALLSHPCPVPTTRICFSQLKRGVSHCTSPKKQFLYICFPLKQHHLPGGVGSVKVLKLRCGGFLHKAGVLTMVAWRSSSSARTARLSRCSGSRGSAPRTV